MSGLDEKKMPITQACRSLQKYIKLRELHIDNTYLGSNLVGDQIQILKVEYRRQDKLS